MKTVVIGIHGLRNKPPADLLTKWWIKSIVEGFRVINLPVPRFSFKLAYWAQYMHPLPQDSAVTDRDDARYLWEPYVEGTYFGPRAPNTLKKSLRNDIHRQLLQLIAGEAGFMNVEALSNRIVHRMFVELDTYYHGNLRDASGKQRPARELIRNELQQLLHTYRHRNICLLAHSMGTIIAYDVLLHCARSLPVHTFITFGSPLGFPVIRNHIQQELGLANSDKVTLPTPDTIRHRWLNFSDLDDVTCLDYNLRNHYQANKRGIRPYDRIVYNDYEYNGTPNPHKAYGYLRTLDITQALNTFLVLENSGIAQRIGWLFKPPPV
ncbi:MAG: hypothetical protein JW863_15600 [Chitinispirillaceae bacterium]|nr:hypothetical protein [Chitinispirillaceae bacterium]